MGDTRGGRRAPRVLARSTTAPYAAAPPVKPAHAPVLALVLVAVSACSTGHGHPAEIGDTPGPDTGVQGPGDGTTPDGVAMPMADGAAQDATLPSGGDAGLDGPGPTDAPSDVVLPSTCPSGKVSVTGDIFNPNDVYFFAQIPIAATAAPVAPLAITHWSDFDAGCVGFPSGFAGGPSLIRTTDGRMLYLDDERVLREFHSDSCVTFSSATVIPRNVLDNDTIIPTPGCVSEDGGPNPVVNFEISPEGDLYFACFDSRGLWWYDANGAQVYKDTDFTLKRVGHGKLAYTNGVVTPTGYATPTLVNLATGNVTDVRIPAYIAASLLAVRAADNGGFWLAIEPPLSSHAAELWQITADGGATNFGRYPAKPMGPTSFIDNHGYLDGCNRLVQAGTSIQPDVGYYVRRTMGGTSDILLNDSQEQVLTMSGYLLSGP
jgi:hypothetical protein